MFHAFTLEVLWVSSRSEELTGAPASATVRGYPDRHHQRPVSPKRLFGARSFILAFPHPPLIRFVLRVGLHSISWPYHPRQRVHSLHNHRLQHSCILWRS
jgi:hypothetical protein